MNTLHNLLAALVGAMNRNPRATDAIVQALFVLTIIIALLLGWSLPA